MSLQMRPFIFVAISEATKWFVIFILLLAHRQACFNTSFWQREIENVKLTSQLWLIPKSSIGSSSEEILMSHKQMNTWIFQKTMVLTHTVYWSMEYILVHFTGHFLDAVKLARYRIIFFHCDKICIGHQCCLDLT